MSQPQKRRSATPGPRRSARCTWLAGDLLLVTSLPRAAKWTGVARLDGGDVELQSAGLTYAKAEEGTSGIALLRFPVGGRGPLPESVVLRARGNEIALDRDALAAAEIGIEQLVGEELKGGQDRSRWALLDLILSHALPGLAGAGGLTLARRLRALRDELRDPLPPLLSDPENSQSGSLELVMAVDDRSFWIVGWVHDEEGTLRGLTVVTPEGQRADLLENAYRHRRPDVEETYGEGHKHGFVNFLRLPHPSLLDRGWLAELHRSDGSSAQLAGPEVIRDPAHVRNRILDEFGRERAAREELRHGHAHPALTRLQERRRALVEVEEVIEHGPPAEAPETSVVIPLYQRVDLVEHQLVHFANDPQLSRADLVFVLDSPELAPQLKPLAAELHALHRVPFRIVVLARNAGYSAANNAGVAHARGRLVLLLNSDVIPVRAGWLERMADFYDSTPQIGALGPKLLYEDLSIQHAGMYFERETLTSLWGNRHYFKGFHRDFAQAGISRPVPAVTGACLMVSRALYNEAGGLSDLFVQGGYEDSDFCIKLTERGLRNWYLADAELYHLEAQSYSSPARQLATLYNTWLQTQLWSEAIERLMKAQEAAEQGLIEGDRLAVSSQLSSVG